MPNISLNEKIFLAGSSGMVGSSIYKALKKNGFGNKNIGGEIFTPTRSDLNLFNKVDLNNWFEKNNPSVVIIAAAKVGGIYSNFKNPADFLLENLKIQTNLIETSWRSNVKRLIFLGSSCIYPKLTKQPIKEEYLLEGPLEATNEYYALAKIAGIKLCEALNIQYKFDSISLMPTNLYGPGDNYDLVNSHVMPALIRKFCDAVKNNEKNVTCWGSGSPLREFLHVDDLSDALIFCLKHWDPNKKNSPTKNNGKPLYYLNIGTGKDISIKELAYKIAKLTDFKGDILWDNTKPDGTPQKRLDVQRINNLGWTYKIKLEDGIRETIENYKQTQCQL